jgi:hypothetical protein
VRRGRALTASPFSPRPHLHLFVTACTHTQTHTKNVSILRYIHTYRRYMVYQHISLSVPPSLVSPSVPPSLVSPSVPPSLVSLYLSFPLLKVCAKTRSIHLPRGLRAIAYVFNDSFFCILFVIVLPAIAMMPHRSRLPQIQVSFALDAGLFGLRYRSLLYLTSNSDNAARPQGLGHTLEYLWI